VAEYLAGKLIALGLSETLAGAIVNFGASLALNAAVAALNRRSTSDTARELATPTANPPYRFAYGRAKIQGTPVFMREIDDVLYMAILLNSRPSAGGVFRLWSDARDVGLSGDIYDLGDFQSGTGTVVEAATTATVTHGLSDTPVAGDVTAWTDAGEVLAVDTLTATTFRVVLTDAAPSGGTAFNWSGVIKTDGAQATNSPFQGYLNFWLGLGDQLTPPARIMSEVGDLTGLNSAKLWSTDRFSGLTVLWVRADEGPAASLSDRWPAWPPSIAVEADWSKVYDPREVGHDDADPDTWEYSNNQALCLLDYLIANPVEPYPISQLRVDDFDAAADLADESVALNSGGSQSRYTVGGIVVFGSEELNELAWPIEQAGAGSLVRIDGQIGYSPGEYQAPEITLDEVMRGQPMKFSARAGSREMPGAIQASFSDPASDWELSALAPFQVDPNWDGSESRITGVSLDFVTNPQQAMRVQQIMGRQAALTKRLTASFPPVASQAVAGGTVTVDFPISGDTRNMIARVDSSDPANWLSDESQAPFAIPLSLRETASTVYDWVPATDEQDFYEAGEAPADPSIPVPESLSGAVNGADIDLTIGMAGFLITDPNPIWTADAKATSAEWHFRRNQNGFWQIGGTATNTAEYVVETLTPVATGESYDFRARSLFEDRYSTWIYDLAVQVGFTLAAPTSFTATPGSGQIALSVTAPSGSSFYALQFWGADSDDPEAAALLSEQTGSAGAVYTHTETGLLASQTRYYFARAVTSDAAVGPWASANATTT